MASQIDICKMALVLLGAQRITALSDTSEEAIKLNIIFEPSRKAEIESFPWNFATKRATLALLTETPDHKYSYLFQLPSDCLRVIRLSDPDIEYRVEGDKIATDETEIEIEYIANITDTSKFPSLFVAALAARLAWELSISITDKEGIWDRFEKLYKERHAVASFSDSQQGTPLPLTQNRWIDTRLEG